MGKYLKTNEIMEISTMFLWFSIIQVVCYIRTFNLMPKESIPFNVSEISDYDFSYKVKKTQKIEEEKSSASFMNSFLSLLFAFNVLYFGALVVRWNYFVSSFNAWMTFFVDGLIGQCDQLEAVSKMTDVLGLIQMSEAVLLAPIVGGVVDLSRVLIRKRSPAIETKQLQLLSNCVSIFLCVFLGILSSWLPTVHILNLQYLTIVSACLFRSFMVGTTASFISLCFPNEHFGKLYGITRVVGALTTLTAVPIFKAVVNSGNEYDLGNYFFLALSSITLLHPIYILKVARKPESEGEVGDKLLKL